MLQSNNTMNNHKKRMCYAGTTECLLVSQTMDCYGVEHKKSQRITMFPFSSLIKKNRLKNSWKS